MRVADWNDQLAQTIEAWRARPRVFGSTDCCQFVGEMVLAMTGTDYREQFPAYADEAGALEILAAHGGMVGMLTTVWGDPKPVAWAKVGDVVAGDFGEGDGCGICLGVWTASMGKDGLVFLQTLKASAAWSI